MKKIIENVTTDSLLLDLLDHYIDVDGQNETTVSEIILKLGQVIANPELIVPVLGTQGTGKSTLINAILGVNILPNDADETTCVPVEIRFGVMNKAIVHFQSGDMKIIESSCEALREFVDNNENDGNCKGVSYIALETPCEILKSGLVIVDLPGVGSLTKNNQETTMRYIRQLCTAIFVIPTVPTIRRSEEIFIRGAWSSFGSAIFVQNRWDDETDEEVNDAVSFNTLVLEKIAQLSNSSYDGEICVVNAYKAVLSRINNDEAECAKSNLPELLKILTNIGDNRKEYDINSFKTKICSYIDSAECIITQYIHECKMNKEELLAERERIREEFNTTTNQIQLLVDDLFDYVNEEKDKCEKFSKKLSRESAESLRADIFRLIDSGIVDGGQLTDAFADYQEKYLMDAIEQHYDYMQRLTYGLSRKLEVLADKIRVEKASSFEALKFENGQAFKIEKGMEIGFDVAGALGGLWVGSFVNGAVAELTFLGSAGGPVGAIVGLVAGLGVTIIGSILGKKTRQEFTSQRASKTKKAIEPYINEFEENIYSSISSNLNKVTDGIGEVLKNYMEERRDYYMKMMRSKEQLADNNYKEQFDEVELNQHFAYLERKMEELNDI